MKLIVVLLCCFTIVHNYRRGRMLSSSSLWVFCYLMIFVMYPVFSGKEYDNYVLIDICAIVGNVFYFLGLVFAERIALKTRENKRVSKPNFNVSYIAFWATLILFLISIILKLGTSGLQAVLLGNITANQLAWSDELSMGNLSIYLMNVLIPFVIAVWIRANKEKKVEKLKALVCLCVYVVVSLVFSYTRLFMICTLVVIFLYEMRYKKPRKQLLTGVFVIAIFTLLMIFLNFFRNFGSSKISNFRSYINIGYVFESTDFGASYRWFSELLKYESPYIIPVAYLKPFFSFVPRSIWSNKPEPISLDILKMLAPELASSGYSTAGNSVLGEGYAVMGWIGIAVFPFIWGYVCTLLDRKYQVKLSNKEDNSLWIIGYYIFTAFIVISCQRGDWSQYGTIIIWLFMLPLYFMSKIGTE